jgi:hypothetical protein
MLGIIVEIIGEEAAAKLIASFGGTRLYVPHSPCANDALARAVGAGAALKLAEMFGGERVELPKPPPRRTQILALRAAGRSVEEIARAMSCTRRRVFQVLAEARRELCGGGTSICSDRLDPIAREANASGADRISRARAVMALRPPTAPSA